MLLCPTASRMFGVPVAKHGANAELRQKGKIAVLACGYGGSVGALKAMGALRMGLDEEELKPLVDAWWDANPMVVQFWHDIEQAAITTTETRTPTRVGRIHLSYRSGCLFIALPSGRELCYPRPRLGENRFGMTSILFDGVDGTT